jgi:ABC-type uncharacterized transport system permease subunit
LLVDALFWLAATCYGLASALLLAYLSGAGERPVTSGSSVLLLAAGLHLVHDVLRWQLERVGPFSGIGPALSLLALLIVGTFLVIRRLRPRVEVVGAFVAPITFGLMLASRTHGRGPMGGGALFALHIGANMVGVAALTVACAMAVAYLIQERQVKNRRLGTLFRRLPPLDVLDTLAYRCVLVGLPALTVGVVTGHIVAVRGVHVRGLPWQQYFAMISWALFAAVLLLRVGAGWRGRRAAIGTILGYASALLVLLFYSVRGGAA